MSKEIYVRLGASDAILTKEQFEEDPDTQPEDVTFYFIGYEDENGVECDEEGEPLCQ